MKHYAKAGILGVNTESRNAIGTTFLNLYFRGQLMWHPDADVDANANVNVDTGSRRTGIPGQPHPHSASGTAKSVCQHVFVHVHVHVHGSSSWSFLTPPAAGPWPLPLSPALREHGSVNAHGGRNDGPVRPVAEAVRRA